jgi:hypothetical protein
MEEIKMHGIMAAYNGVALIRNKVKICQMVIETGAHALKERNP